MAASSLLTEGVSSRLPQRPLAVSVPLLLQPDPYGGGKGQHGDWGREGGGATFFNLRNHCIRTPPSPRASVLPGSPCELKLHCAPCSAWKNASTAVHPDAEMRLAACLCLPHSRLRSSTPETTANQRRWQRSFYELQEDDAITSNEKHLESLKNSGSLVRALEWLAPAGGSRTGRQAGALKLSRLGFVRMAPAEKGFLMLTKSDRMAAFSVLMGPCQLSIGAPGQSGVRRRGVAGPVLRPCGTVGFGVLTSWHWSLRTLFLLLKLMLGAALGSSWSISSSANSAVASLALEILQAAGH
ncbi:hypothetical protein J1605_008584 [Eschrichtius robustus]|uniref:Uncharacterized protein n=1 Tax=Eschrichtius robustus TaxID=9764 RepID=A0AB34H0A0_ESCRO|nr:hypothetical protein J1605_008584 [Eschrichtius robustus]